MKLTGEFTVAGAALSAQVLAGNAELSITRAAAGSGYTDSAAFALENEQMALAIDEHSVSGSTLTVPVRLISLEAPGSFMLSEIGLYALSGSGEILYKVYRISQAISVSPDCALAATFYLSDTVIPGSVVDARVSPAGLMSSEQGDALRAQIAALPDEHKIRGMVDTAGAYRANEPTNISCAGAELQTQLNTMPRAIDNDLTITVTGTVPGGLTVSSFYGPGTLRITGGTGEARTLINGVPTISNCDLQLLRFENFETNGASKSTGVATYEGLSTAPVHVLDCKGKVYLRQLLVAKPGTQTSTIGIFVRSSYCIIDECRIQNRHTYISAYLFASIVVNAIPKTGDWAWSGASRMFDLLGGCQIWCPIPGDTTAPFTGIQRKSSVHISTSNYAIDGGGYATIL